MSKREFDGQSSRAVGEQHAQPPAESEDFRKLLEAVRGPAAVAEAALGGEASTASAGTEPAASRAAAEEVAAAPTPASLDGAAALGSPIVVGEVLQARHPDHPGRALVRWRDPRPIAAGADRTASGWLELARHLSLRAGDRVLLTLPDGWSEWIVTGVLGPEPAAPPPDPGSEREIRLQPGESVRFVSHAGRPLVTLRQDADGSVIELGEDSVELKAGRTLRLTAQRVEIATSGDIDLRSDGDTVVRGRYIRLN